MSYDCRVPPSIAFLGGTVHCNVRKEAGDVVHMQILGGLEYRRADRGFA